MPHTWNILHDNFDKPKTSLYANKWTKFQYEMFYFTVNGNCKQNARYL